MWICTESASRFDQPRVPAAAALGGAAPGSKAGRGDPSKVSVQSALLPGQDTGSGNTGHCLGPSPGPVPANQGFSFPAGELNFPTRVQTTTTSSGRSALCLDSRSWEPDHCPRPLTGFISEIYSAALSRRPSIFPQRCNEITNVCLPPSEKLKCGGRARPAGYPELTERASR